MEQEKVKKERKKFNKTKRDYSEIVTKYQTGLYTLGQLSKMYGIPKSTLSEHLSKHKIEKSEHAPNAVGLITQGFNELEAIKNENKPNTQIESIINETIEIIKEKNPQFAKGFQALSALIIKRGSEILQRDNISSNDLEKVSKAMSNVNDTLGVIPKMPTIAQQFNFGVKNNNKKAQLNHNKEIKVNIEVVNSDVIDVDTEEN